MTENFGKCFYLKPDLNCSRCEGVTERMCVNPVQTTFTGILFDTVLKRTRFHKFRRSRKNVGTRITHGKLSAKLYGIVCQGNGTDRGIAFRCADQNFCFLCCVRIGLLLPINAFFMCHYITKIKQINIFLEIAAVPAPHFNLFILNIHV